MESHVDADPNLLDDPWIWAFLLMAVASGFFCRAYLERLVREGWTAGQTLARGAPLSRIMTRGFSMRLKPKVPGYWVVDQRMAPGADVASVSQAVDNAASGDVITVKSGIYNESLDISRDVTIVGSSPDEVWLTSNGAQTVSVSAGRAVFKNLTLANTGLPTNWVAAFTGGSVSLDGVNVRSKGLGLRVHDADLEAVDGSVSAYRGFAIDGQASVKVLRANVSSEDSGFIASGSSARLQIDRSDLRSEEGSAVEANRFSQVRINDSTLSRNAQSAVTGTSGAEIRIARTTLADNRGCGVSTDGGIFYLDQVTVVHNRCGIAVVGSSRVDVNGSSFSDLSLGAVGMKPGLDRSNLVLHGAGNKGIDIPEQEQR